MKPTIIRTGVYMRVGGQREGNVYPENALVSVFETAKLQWFEEDVVRNQMGGN